MGSKRWLTIAAGVLLALMGTVWALQGAGVLPGSVMSNDPKWIVIGALALVGGATLTYRGMKRS